MSFIHPWTGILIRESGGAVAQVQLLDTSDVWHTVWTGTDPTTGSSDFVLNFEETVDDIKAVRIFLTTENGYPTIDAVKLLTGGTATETILSACSYDYYGGYTETVYNDDETPDTVASYYQGQRVQTQEYTYDTGHVSAILTIDALDRETYATYDEDGNKLTETFAYSTGDASMTTYEYDEEGRMTSLLDPKGNETTWDYSGNVVTMTDPFGKTEIKTYDDDGKLLSIINRNELLRTFEYDEDGRLITETWYDGDTTGDAVVNTFTWTYNGGGLLATASNDDSDYAFRYNDDGQVIHVDEPFGVSLDFSYDDLGNRIIVTDTLGGHEESVYNADYQLLSRTLVLDDQELRIDFTYDAQGRVATEKRYSDLAGTELVATTTFTRDAKGNVTQILHKDSSNDPISDFDYSYDDAGQLESETNMQIGIDSGTPWTNDYSYDGQGQLTDDDFNTYDYDEGGNRDTGYTYVQNPDTIHYTNLIESDGVWGYSYDFEGNLTEKDFIGTDERWVYGYDHARQLIRVEHYDGSNTLDLQVDFKYDVFGNRIEKVVDDDRDAPSSPTTKRFAIDGWNASKGAPIGNENFDVFADLNGSNAPQTRYLRGDGVDEIKGRADYISSSWDQAWTLTDRMGSVRDVIDLFGSPLDSWRYDGFGNIDDTTELDPEYRGRYAWTGREIDVEIELQYNRARYYDPSTGRWISQDPLGFDAGDSNLYRYVNNAPTNSADPSGLHIFGNLFTIARLKQWLFNGKDLLGDTGLLSDLPEFGTKGLGLNAQIKEVANGRWSLSHRQDEPWKKALRHALELPSFRPFLIAYYAGSTVDHWDVSLHLSQKGWKLDTKSVPRRREQGKQPFSYEFGNVTKDESRSFLGHLSLVNFTVDFALSDLLKYRDGTAGKVVKDQVQRWFSGIEKGKGGELDSVIEVFKHIKKGLNTGEVRFENRPTEYFTMNGIVSKTALGETAFPGDYPPLIYFYRPYYESDDFEVQFATVLHELVHYFADIRHDLGYYDAAKAFQEKSVTYTDGEGKSTKLTTAQLIDNPDTYAGFITQYYLQKAKERLDS